MILVTRIPALTERMRQATIEAARRQQPANPDQSLIEELERRGYQVTRRAKAA